MATDFSRLRTNMVDNQVRTTDVTDHGVIDALLMVPREKFVSPSLQPLAYIDEDLPLSPGRYLMAPSPFAKLVQLAGVRPGETVLDVGCASGYSSAVLSRLAGTVVALESDDALAAHAQQTLAALGYRNVSVVAGILADGHKPRAPYDVIFIGGAVDLVPDALLEQLKEGGRLVVIAGQGGAATAFLHVREAGALSSRRVFNCSAKPLPGFEKKEEFVF